MNVSSLALAAGACVRRTRPFRRWLGGDWLNGLLIFVPWAILAEQVTGYSAAWKFTLAALAIVPLAKAMIEATEHIARRTTPTIGALLNATFGNAPELIIALIALQAGLVEMVKASIVGVILGNLLFVLGLALLIGGLAVREQKFNRRGARMQRSVLMIAAISITIPSLFDQFISPETAAYKMALNVSVAIVLLITYGLSLIFMLKTHPEHFVPENPEVMSVVPSPWSRGKAVMVLLLASVMLALMSEVLVGSVEETARILGISQSFIGVIILALIGGAPESIAAVAMARRNKLDLTMGIAVGSSIQIALFVAPALILSSYFIAPRPFDLVVGNAAVTIVILPVLIFSMIVADGKSNWFKGVQLLSVYLLIALFCFFLPDTPAQHLIRP